MVFSEFKDKTVVITGSSSGIGQAQTQRFIEQGAFVYGIDTQPAVLEHPRYLHFQGSITDVFFLQKSLNALETIDVLCNTAGVLDGYAKSLETDEQLWDTIFNVNVKGMYHVTNVVLPKMLSKQQGVIINMASIAGLIAGGGGAAYTASKHAVIGYTKQLSYDYIKEGIRVNAIAPGAIQTPMNAADFAGDGEMAKWVAKETPAQRWAQPEEVANATLFLASNASDYIHAVVLPIDGGWLNK